MGKVFVHFAPFERKRAEFNKFHDDGRSFPHRYNFLSVKTNREKRSRGLRVQENALFFLQNNQSFSLLFFLFFSFKYKIVRNDIQFVVKLKSNSTGEGLCTRRGRWLTASLYNGNIRDNARTIVEWSFYTPCTANNSTLIPNPEYSQNGALCFRAPFQTFFFLRLCVTHTRSFYLFAIASSTSKANIYERLAFHTQTNSIRDVTRIHRSNFFRSFYVYQRRSFCQDKAEERTIATSCHG